MYLGLVLFTDISCHKAATVFIPCPSNSFCVSPLPYTPSFKIKKTELYWLYVVYTIVPTDKYKNINNTRYTVTYICHLTFPTFAGLLRHPSSGRRPKQCICDPRGRALLVTSLYRTGCNNKDKAIPLCVLRVL
jgi:hypothetical protein